MKRVINVTQPYLPPLNEFFPYLESIWEKKWLTNNGEFHQQLETELASYLGVPYISLFSNGTLALLTALQCLEIKGEVITTPYSFVATSHALVWNNIKPVFADVDPVYGNLNPHKVKAAITDKTSAILPVHVYGHPCETEAFEEIAANNNLKVIYDAAHAFGVKLNNESVLNFGDLSILSFHATKVYNTFEGGAIICHDIETKRKIDDLKNFGFHDEVTVVSPGINAKMNELQAAMGLLQLKHIDEIIRKRKKISERYKSKLQSVKGLTLLTNQANTDYNYSYFPIFIDVDFGVSRDKLYNHLKEHNIYARRYFYPLISEFPVYSNLISSRPDNLPNAYKFSQKVICLPIYPDLSLDMVDEICNIIFNA